MRKSFLVLWLFVSAAGMSQPFQNAGQLMLDNQRSMGDDQALLVYANGSVQHQKLLGTLKPNLQVPLGETSQWLTAALVLVLVQEGVVSLDDKVGKYLPIFPKWMKSYVTLRHCLTHTTGIEPDKAGAGRLLQKKSFATLEEAVNFYAEKRDIAANPGQWFYYNQIGPEIAGRVLEVATKKKFDRLIQEKLLRPLNMRSTSFTNFNGAISPFNGGKTSAADLMNFLSMVLQKGSFMGKQILTENSIKEFTQLQTTAAINKFTPPFYEGSNYSLGCWAEQKNGSRISAADAGGCFAWVDFCKGYAAVWVSKTERSSLPRSLYLQMQDAVSTAFPANCK